jgi:hypothetical protein
MVKWRKWKRVKGVRLPFSLDGDLVRDAGKLDLFAQTSGILYNLGHFIQHLPTFHQQHRLRLQQKQRIYNIANISSTKQIEIKKKKSITF